MTIAPEYIELAAPKPTSMVIPVSSEMAARWLKLNTRNRALSPIVVDQYLNDMAAGNWTFAADPIRFSVNGNLLDGQHRLTALAALDGHTIPMLVVRGLPEESQLVMDQGRKRQPGAQLELLGIKYANHIAAAAKVYIIWESGAIFKDNKAQRLSSPRIQQWVASHPELVEAANSHHAILMEPDSPPSVTQAAFMRFHQISESGAHEFFASLASGAGLSEGDPILALDKRLRRIRKEGFRVTNRDVLALFILAWNAWRDGRSMAKFQKPKGAAWTAESFPEPK